MNDNSNETETPLQNPTHKKSQVLTFRLPYDTYEKYEIRCIELQIEMSEILRQAVAKFMNDKN